MCTCIPIGFLKVWIFIAALTNIGIGIGFIILGTIIKKFDGDLLEIIDDPEAIKNIINYIFIGCVAVGAFIIFLGLITILAGIK